VAAQAERAIAEDGLVMASDTQETNPSLIVERAMREVAVEAASLLYSRQRAVRAGADGAKLASRRVQALLRISELAVLRETLRRESGEMDPDHVERAVAMLVEAVREVVQDVAAPEVASRFMSRLKEKMRQADFPASACTQRTSP
jgi:Zn-dependent protease with chaperone function